MQNNLVDMEVQTDKRIKDIHQQEATFKEPEPKESLQHRREVTSKEEKPEKIQNDSGQQGGHLPSINNSHISVPPKMSAEQEKERSQTIRKLTLENKKLIEQLKKMNDLLTTIITKQASKSIRKRRQSGVSVESQGIHKELQQAYKQVDRYKKIIDRQKSKELPIQQFSRVNDLENKIKSYDIELKNMKKQIKTIHTIKGTQDKQISRQENEGPKSKVERLTKDILQYKDRLKNVQKQATRQAQKDRGQHEHLICLERLNKEMSQALDGTKKKKELPKYEEQISQQQWTTLKTDLAKAIQHNKAAIKRIDELKKDKKKSSQSQQESDLTLKQRTKKQQLLQKKLNETKTLMILKRPVGGTLQSNTDFRGTHTWARNTSNEKSVAVGKQLPGALGFSDGKLFLDAHQVRIKKLNIWTNQANQICGLAAMYQINQSATVSGNLIGNCQGEKKELQLEDSPIVRLSGTFDNNGLVVSLRVMAKSGDVWGAGMQDGIPFEISHNNDYISQLGGSYNLSTRMQIFVILNNPVYLICICQLNLSEDPVLEQLIQQEQYAKARRAPEFMCRLIKQQSANFTIQVVIWEIGINFSKEYKHPMETVSTHAPLSGTLTAGTMPFDNMSEGTEGSLHLETPTTPDISNPKEDKDRALQAVVPDELAQKENRQDQNSGLTAQDQLQEEATTSTAQDTQKIPECAANACVNPPRPLKTNSLGCWNKLCAAKRAKRTKSRVNGRTIFLCSTCSKHYNNGQFCEYCQQIYCQDAVDGEEWILCQTEGCGRWNHTQCENNHGQLNAGDPYYCNPCSDKLGSRNSQIHKQEAGQSEPDNRDFKGLKLINQYRVFRVHREVFGNLDSMLTSFSYRLGLSQDQLKSDVLFQTKRKPSWNGSYSQTLSKRRKLR